MAEFDPEILRRIERMDGEIRRLRQELDHIPVRFTTGSGGTDWFWARLNGLPTPMLGGSINTDVDLGGSGIPGLSGHGVDNELSAFRFLYSYAEVRPIYTYTDENGDPVLNDWELIPTGSGGRAGADAINTVETAHRIYSSGLGDSIPWMVYGANVVGTYYPGDFHPLPPGVLYITVTGERGYFPYSDFGSHQPVVRVTQTNDIEGRPFAWFTQMGTHDGGCAPLPD